MTAEPDTATPPVAEEPAVPRQRVKSRKYGTGRSYTIDGEWVPGVTTVLDVLSKGGLINWAANKTIDYAVDNWPDLARMKMSERIAALQRARFDDRDEAGKRGQEIHALAAKLVRDEKVTIPEPLRGHVESAVRYMDKWQPEPILVEAVVANFTWQYCGRLDLVERLPDGRVRIVDWKSARKGVYPGDARQVTAYRWAEVYVGEDGLEHPMSELEIAEGVGVWIRADGYDVYPLNTSEEVFRDFLHVLWTWRSVEYREKTWKGAALPEPHWPAELLEGTS